ncbi:Uncharacterized protein APZ42_017468 [Daphnia magna]|uniref:Uncharacterized protein n=1 Tax=Daphnia magna TaxID=35525 RepID=A0A164ZVJ3_9CRUS|nr:Uncharacterized protein APZ42_017468 [Daphnia magna]
MQPNKTSAELVNENYIQCEQNCVNHYTGIRSDKCTQVHVVHVNELLNLRMSTVRHWINRGGMAISPSSIGNKKFALQPIDLWNYVPLPYTFLPGKPGCGTCLRVFKAVASHTVSHSYNDLQLHLFYCSISIVGLYACQNATVVNPFLCR